ncbi:substrate-binding domain-containing protein [Metamycoplasma buccale]|uniref:substrate-binding domain-containing protein n=1 Tax=Metamycoplasma buccale TaxID=55602 RepID=UPI00398EF6D6
MKKKFPTKKLFTYLPITVGVVSIPLLIGLNIKKVNVINIAGSSSIQPFLNDVANKIEKTNFETNIQSRGSTFGILNSVKQENTLGVASKSPRETINEYKLNDVWKNRKMKTITFGLEGIGLLAKLPKELDPNKVEINQNNINELYKAFAGKEKVNIKNFINDNSIKEKFDFNWKPFAKNGGAFSSGTAESFLLNSGFKNKIPKNISDVLEGKENYGKNTKITAESNLEAFNYFKNEGKEIGSITYLSLGFILNHIEEIKKMGYSLINVNYGNGPIVPSNENIQSGKYKWTRPFNLLASLDKIKPYVKKFIKELMFTNNYDYLYKEHGILKLSNKDLKKMFKLTKDEIDNLNFNLKENLGKFYYDDYSLNRYGVEHE